MKSLNPISGNDRLTQMQLDPLVSLYQRGQLAEAVALAKYLARQFPREWVLLNILGAAYAGLGQVDAATKNFQKVLKLNPKSAEAYCNIGNLLLMKDDFGAAIIHYRRALLLNPDFAEAHSNLGLALRQKGDFAAALKSCESALRLRPDYPDALNNLGTTQLDAGDTVGAIATLQKALSLTPGFSEVHYNLGNAYKALGELDRARDAYDAAIVHNANHANAYYNIGLMERQRGDTIAALKAYQLATEKNPDHALAFNNLAILHQEMGNRQAAEANFNRARSLRPNDEQIFANLCELEEKSNDLKALHLHLTSAENRRFLKFADIRYYEAVLAYRSKDYATCARLLGGIDPQRLGPERLTPFYNLSGRNAEKQGDYDRAFAAFDTMNKATRALPAFDAVDREAYFKALRLRLDQLRRAPPCNKRPDTDDGQTPCFLIGFPRSGTTLLDTILRSHSKIGVFEEKPYVAQMAALLGQDIGIAGIEALDQAQIAGLRRHYFQMITPDADVPHPPVIIDKLPLNAFHAPLIHRVFPKAKFILALRHPLDSIISNFMQNFGLNPAMANMSDLPRIAQYYDLVMETWQLSQARYGLSVHQIRYEDLVSDLKGQITPLVGFLGLEWQENLVNYQSTAKDRGLINTPSYSQVIEPLYKDATDRWKNYADYLAPHRATVGKWIELFGYD